MPATNPPRPTMDADFRRTLACVEHYRKLGLCPLPSRMDVKGPMLASYAQHYQGVPVPGPVYADWRTTNVQVLTGTMTPTPTKLAVVDCDGPEADDVWHKILSKHSASLAGCWAATTGSGGRHYYFRLADPATPCPSRLLWGLWDTWGDDGRGRWVKHREVRLLADNALVIAPPSVHVDTGERYRFDAGASPKRHALPAPAPAWLLALPGQAKPDTREKPKAEPFVKRPVQISGAYYDRDDVLAAIDDKLALAKTWGVAFKHDIPNPNRYVTCWVPGREDPRFSKPSGSFHVDDGTLQDRMTGETMPFFDIALRLGRFGSFRECVGWCGDQYLKPRRNEATRQFGATVG